MPTCQRCETRTCRVQCPECQMYACEPCRTRVNGNHLCLMCNHRRIPRFQTNKVIVRRNQMYCEWSRDVTQLLDTMYLIAGSPPGIRLHSASLIEHGWSSPDTQRNPIRDRYTRLDRHYTCLREFIGINEVGGVTMVRVRLPMFLSEEQKESIAASAMHPSRLQKWLDRGWEDEWEDYFS